MKIKAQLTSICFLLTNFIFLACAHGGKKEGVPKFKPIPMILEYTCTLNKFNEKQKKNSIDKDIKITLEQSGKVYTVYENKDYKVTLANDLHPLYDPKTKKANFKKYRRSNELHAQVTPKTHKISSLGTTTSLGGHLFLHWDNYYLNCNPFSDTTYQAK